MKEEFEEQFKDMWTTHKDEYCLVKNGPRYNIMGSTEKTMTLIRELNVVDELIANMIKAGVRVFDTMEEWDAFVESQPGYTTAHWWDDPNAESPFLKNGRPPKPRS